MQQKRIFSHIGQDILHHLYQKLNWVLLNRGLHNVNMIYNVLFINFNKKLQFLTVVWEQDYWQLR